LLVVGVTIACAVSVILALRGRRPTDGPVIAGLVAIFVTILAGLSASVFAPSHFGAAHGTPGPGVGVYTGLVGGLFMLVGGLLIRRSPGARWLAALSCAGVLVVAWGLAGLGGRAPVVGVGVFMDGGAWLTFPNDGTTPEERRKVGYDNCAAHSVESLARLLGTRATTEAVARGYSRYFGDQEELYWGCLQAFNEKR
jgi:hypothetical protein